MVIAASGIEFHHPGGVGDSFDAGKREHDPDEPGPVLTKRSVQRLQMSDRFAHVRQMKSPRTTTTIAVGTEIKNASPPVCFGPSKLSKPIIRIAAAANFSGCGTPRYANAERALMAAVTK